MTDAHDRFWDLYLAEGGPTPTPDVREAVKAALEAAAAMAENFTHAQHVAHDIKTGIFPEQSPNREAMAGCIRALDPDAIIQSLNQGTKL